MAEPLSVNPDGSVVATPSVPQAPADAAMTPISTPTQANQYMSPDAGMSSRTSTSSGITEPATVEAQPSSDGFTIPPKEPNMSVGTTTPTSTSTTTQPTTASSPTSTNPKTTTSTTTVQPTPNTTQPSTSTIAFTPEQVKGLEAAYARQLAGTANSTDLTNLNYAMSKGWAPASSTTSGTSPVPPSSSPAPTPEATVKIQPVITPIEQSALDDLFNASSGSITSDTASNASNLVKTLIDRANATLLSDQNYDAGNTAEMQGFNNEINEFKKGIQEGADAQTSLITAYQSQLATQRALHIEDIHAQAKEEYDGQVEANKQAVARAQVWAANGGIIGSSQELQYISDTIASGRKALERISDSERRAINEAQLAFATQDFQLAQAKLQVAQDARNQFQDLFYKQVELKKTADDMLMRRQEFGMNMLQSAQTMEVQRLELEGKKSDAAQTKIQNLLAGGFRLNADTAPEFVQIAKSAGWDVKTLKSYVSVSEQTVEANKVKVVAERQKMELENAKNLVGLLKDVPLGQSIKINGTDYTGLDRGDVKTGTETDAQGRTTFWEYNPAVNGGKVKTTNLGFIGKAQDGWSNVQTDQGWYSYNIKTGQYVPIQPSLNTTTIQSLVPEGSRSNPFRPEKGASGVQCGEWMNDCNDPSVGRIWGDSLQQKLSVASKSEWAVPVAQATVGDTIVQGGSWTGHVFRILDERTDPNGRKQWQKFEANMVPPGGGAITSTAWVYADDPKNLAAARVPTRPEFMVGTDSPISQQPTGPTIGGRSLSDVFGGGSAEIDAWTNMVKNGTSIGSVPDELRSRVAINVAKTSAPKPSETFEQFVERRQNESGMSIEPAKLKGQYDQTKKYTTQLENSISKIAAQGHNPDQRNEVKTRLSSLLSSGDYDALEGQLRDEAVNMMPAAQQEAYNQYANGIDSWNEAKRLLENSKDVTTGPYKTLFESKKPYLLMTKDQKFVDLFNRIELGQAQVRRGFYGTAVTETEAGTAKKFLIDENDDLSTIWTKLNNGSAYMRFVNDATVAQRLGLPRPQLNEYLKAVEYKPS